MQRLLIIGVAGVVAGSVAVAATSTVASQAADTLPSTTYDAILASAYPADGPGATAIVTHGGTVVYRGAVGMADLELDVPLEPDMVFRLGSITKQFTAAAIMMLVEEGKLSVDDPLSTFLPDYPGGADVTVEHLLTHTSGIKSYTGIPGHMATEIHKDLTVDELIDVFKMMPVDFQPGTRFAYNNSGYVLLGAIIEKASGQTYEAFIQDRLFDSLGMTSSYYGSNERIIPRRVAGYEGGPGSYQNAQYLSMTQPYAAGSLLSTVDDLVLWNTGLFGGAVLSPESIEAMTTPYTLLDGEETSYGYGFFDADIRGHQTINHGGGIFGFRTDGLYLPDDDVYVAVLSNSAAGTPPSMVSALMAALAIGEPFVRPQGITVSEEILARYVGVYKVDDDTNRIVTVKDGALFTKRGEGERLAAVPSSETEFFYAHALTHLEFIVEPSGRASGMIVYQGGSRTGDLAEKISDDVPEETVAEVDPSIYDGYTGDYELMPGFVLAITREGDRLMGQATGQPKVELSPKSETEFVIEMAGAKIVFVVGADGEATELVLHQGGQVVPAKRK